MGAPHVSTQANGIHPGGPRVARAALMGEREPLYRVFALGSRAWTTISVALLVAAAVHGAVGARAALASLEIVRFAREVEARVAQRLADTYDIEDLQKAADPEPPPPKEEEPEPAKAVPPPAPKEQAPPPPPPAAAQAGQVMTSEPDPNEPVDMTNSFISVPGSGNFAGGTTQAGGTSTKPVANANARTGGVPGGTGTAPAPPPPGPDRSRIASFNGSTEWQCPWPEEADAEQIDEAYVPIEVAVNADGRPSQVTILKDPGHGFARKARECAMSKTFAAALDRDGRSIPGKTKPFRIHFER